MSIISTDYIIKDNPNQMNIGAADNRSVLPTAIDWILDATPLSPTSSSAPASPFVNKMQSSQSIPSTPLARQIVVDLTLLGSQSTPEKVQKQFNLTIESPADSSQFPVAGSAEDSLFFGRHQPDSGQETPAASSSTPSFDMEDLKMLNSPSTPSTLISSEETAAPKLSPTRVVRRKTLSTQPVAALPAAPAELANVPVDLGSNAPRKRKLVF